MSNHIKHCIELAREALSTWSNSEVELESTVIDCLTDLRHLCDAEGFDFYEKLDQSYDHYIHEKAEESQHVPS